MNKKKVIGCPGHQGPFGPTGPQGISKRGTKISILLKSGKYNNQIMKMSILFKNKEYIRIIDLYSGYDTLYSGNYPYIDDKSIKLANGNILRHRNPFYINE